MTLPNGTTAYGMNGEVILAGTFIGDKIISGKIQSVDGKVYFDLDNSVIAANKLVSTTDGATDFYAKIGTVTWTGGTVSKGLGLYSADATTGTLAYFSQMGKDALNNNGFMISADGDLTIRSNTESATNIENDNTFKMFTSTDKTGNFEMWRSRGDSADDTCIFQFNKDIGTITQDFSTDASNYGRLIFDLTSLALNRIFSSSNWGSYTLASDGSATIYSGGGTRAKFTSARTDIYSPLYVNGVIVTSDRDKKTDIVSQDEVCAIDEINKMKFYKYTMLEKVPDTTVRMATINGYDNNIIPLDTAPLIIEPSDYQVEMGTMYDEAPDLIKVHDGQGTKAIDQYAYTSLIAKGTQELSLQVRKIESEKQDLVKRLEVLEKSISLR
jgi:hypothetical protein